MVALRGVVDEVFQVLGDDLVQDGVFGSAGLVLRGANTSTGWVLWAGWVRWVAAALGSRRLAPSSKRSAAFCSDPSECARFEHAVAFAGIVPGRVAWQITDLAVALPGGR